VAMSVGKGFRLGRGMTFPIVRGGDSFCQRREKIHALLRSDACIAFLDIDCQEDGGWLIWQNMEAAARALGPKCLLKNSGPGKKDVPQGLKPNIFSILLRPD